MDFFAEKDINEKSLEKVEKKDVQVSKTLGQLEHERNASTTEKKTKSSAKPNEV